MIYNKMKLIDILKEIRINNINKPSHFPKDKTWYTKTDTKEDAIKLTRYLLDNGYMSHSRPGYIRNLLNGEFPDPMYNRENYFLFHKGGWVMGGKDWFDNWVSNPKYIPFNVINEIRINNVNKPTHFPKDETWYTKVSTREDVIKLTKYLLDNGYPSHSRPSYIEKILNGEFPTYPYNGDYYFLHHKGAWIMSGQDWFDTWVNIPKYIPFNIINEIKIRNLNKPTPFPTNIDWYTEVSKNELDDFYIAMENSNIITYREEFPTLQRILNDRGRLYVAYIHEKKELYWHLHNDEIEHFKYIPFEGLT